MDTHYKLVGKPVGTGWHAGTREMGVKRANAKTEN